MNFQKFIEKSLFSVYLSILFGRTKSFQFVSFVVLGPLFFLVFYWRYSPKTVSYSAIFADDLSSIFFFNKPNKIIRLMKAYFASLVEWLFKWRLKMNASNCCYTIFSRGGRGNLELDLRLNGEPIPCNPGCKE